MGVHFSGGDGPRPVGEKGTGGKCHFFSLHKALKNGR